MDLRIFGAVGFGGLGLSGFGRFRVGFFRLEDAFGVVIFGPLGHGVSGAKGA